MKINKEDIRESIEYIISDGIMECEEVDVTTEKIMKTVWPIIDHLAVKSKTRKRI